MTFTFPVNDNYSAAIALPIASRKRKDVDESGDNEDSPDRNIDVKGIRRWANVPDGSQEAQFHPLPQELNLQILANLGYNVTNQDSRFDATRHGGGFNHSPSSSASSLYPSTPNDVVPASAESYFAKGMQSEAGPSPAYPNFNIYPESEHIYPRPPGLMGMHMHHKSNSSVGSDGDGMELDGGSAQEQAGPSHGPHCKSIPQLLCRGNGATKELWAQCRDCGTMSQVDSRPSEPLAYSP